MQLNYSALRSYLRWIPWGRADAERAPRDGDVGQAHAPPIRVWRRLGLRALGWLKVNESPTPVKWSERSRATRGTTWGLLALVVFVMAVLRRGWMCDDAFITMRVVDHLVAGRGMVFNAGERVLGITNPLWALVLAGPLALTQNHYLVAVLAGVVTSALAASVLVFAVARDRALGALVLVALCFSRSFVDFSTSGLENSLTHLLLFCFYAVLFRPAVRSSGKLVLLSALTVVNRIDALPLLLPGLLWTLWQERRRKGLWWRVLLGATPAIAWFVFAIIYYGFPSPNTTYAKLNTDIPRAEMVRQGFSYLIDVVANDSLTAILIAAALAISIQAIRTQRLAKFVLLALIANLAYVVSVGGDFMSGRFMTAATAVSAAALVHFGGELLRGPSGLPLQGLALGLGALIMSLTFSPFRLEKETEKRDFPYTRIVNERSWYQDHLLLPMNVRPTAWREDGLFTSGVEARQRKERVAVVGNIGLFGLGAGPDVHVLDPLALTDPLLARIPFKYDRGWRTGHLGRDVPEGYVKSLEEGRNLIEDRCLAEYYDRLNQVIRGPLFTRERWEAIIALNSPGGVTVRPCPQKPKTKRPGRRLH
ncbi:MAG TPA: hypothetical protein VFQ61_30825 [Polyangiaceae bacterium]|nr:hypothetical protein [Polyangiaceae bacterium]